MEGGHPEAFAATTQQLGASQHRSVAAPGSRPLLTTSPEEAAGGKQSLVLKRHPDKSIAVSAKEWRVAKNSEIIRVRHPSGGVNSNTLCIVWGPGITF